MTTTPRLGITEMAETQNNREVTVNEAFAKLEAGATFYAAIQVLLNTPPVSPAEGDLYIVGTAGTGVWSGHNKNVTVYYNAAWLFFAPFEGMFAWDQTSDSMKRYDGSAWVAFTATGASVADADYGDITVSGGGATWTIDNDVVTNAKAANMAQSTIKGRAASAGTGDPTDLTVAQVVAIIGDTDGTLAANSDALFATQKATKTYVDQIVAANDAMVFKGSTDCSENPNYPAADRGHTYRVSVAGKIGGASGVNVEAGDLFICLTDGTASGNQATVGSNWTIAQANLDGAVIGPASVTDGNPAVFDGITGKLLKQQTFTQFTASLIAMVGDSGSGGTKGLVPAPTAGDAAAGKFLKADGTFAVPAGTGVGSTASTTEVLTGTDAAKAVTPASLFALWKKGADVASASTVTLGDGGFFHITGTTTITAIAWTTQPNGRAATLIFDGILTLTYNATSLKLPGNANITTAAGDRAIVVEDTSGNVICVAYIRADGTPLLSTILRSDTSSNLTKGFTSTGYSAGTKSSGTFTPDPANGNLQYATNGGAHTLAPPSTGSGDALTMVLQYTNNGSAGTITTSGFTKVTGDALTTTNTSKFLMHITVINSVSHLNVVAMQ